MDDLAELLPRAKTKFVISDKATGKHVVKKVGSCLLRTTPG